MGAIKFAWLAVAMTGQGLALARGRLAKHAIPLDALASGKPVDRPLPNPGIDADALLVHWAPYVAGSRSSVTAATDWTDFDADGQATTMLSPPCRHGRATPLAWLTVHTAAPKDRRNAHGDRLPMRLAEAVPADVRARIVADRGFGGQKLCRMLADELRFDFVVRFRGSVKAAAADGGARPAAERVGAGGRARVLRGATVAAAGRPVAAVACVRATLLGAAGETPGCDRHLKSNTGARRPHPPFRQGGMLHELIPTMPEHRLRPLVEQFAHRLAAQPVFSGSNGAI